MRFKKVGAVALSIAMTFTMGLSALAAANIGADGTVQANDNTVNIAKEIIFKNAETTTVREPNITYTYTIAAANAANATVKDANGLSGTVKNGVAGAITNATSTVTFADTNTATATATGTADSKNASFTFDPTAFTAPGIYRYSIVETQSPTKAAVGVTEAGTYNANRWLDVYVKKTNANSNTMEIYGYVLSEESTSFDADANPTVNLDKKSTGYVDTDATAAGQDNVDVYETENLYIDKTTTGVMADKGNDFPLSIALTGTVAPKLDVTTSNSGAVNNTSTDTVGTYVNFGTITGTVRDTSTITLKGIPVGSTVSIVETNNTPDSYKVKADAAIGSGASSSVLTEAIVAAGANAAATTSVTLSDKVSISFTNTLDAISPTGFAVRFIPYLLVLGFAACLIAFARKTRRSEA